MNELQAWVGRSETRVDNVSASAVARWRATIGSRATPAAGIAPPGFHWCLCLPDAPLAQLGEDGHPRKGGFMPPVALPRRMWVASRVEFLAPVAIGASVELRSRITRITPKTGNSGAMVFVDIDHNHCINGLAAVRERQTIVYRQAPAQPLALPPVRDLDLAPWPLRRSIVPDAPMLFRFSALSFNSHRIHYDLPYAREHEGYPALVVQGPLCATLLLDLAAAHAGCEALSEFSFRALAPAFAGQALHLLARDDGAQVQLCALGADGRTVMEASAALQR